MPPFLMVGSEALTDSRRPSTVSVLTRVLTGHRDAPLFMVKPTSSWNGTKTTFFQHYPRSSSTSSFRSSSTSTTISSRPAPIPTPIRPSSRPYPRPHPQLPLRCPGTRIDRGATRRIRTSQPPHRRRQPTSRARQRQTSSSTHTSTHTSSSSALKDARGTITEPILPLLPAPAAPMPRRMATEMP